MAKNKKPEKSLLSEGTIRRMMKLAEISPLSENFFNEEWGGKKDDRKKGGADEDASQESEDTADYEDPTSAKGKERRKAAGLNEEDEEAELDATEDELGAEDEVADEEGAELDAEAGGEGEAEITPEAAQAIIDLGAQLEAAGAAEEGAEEVEAGAEEMEVGAEEEVEAVEDEELEEDIFEAALRGLGVEVVDDSAARLNEVKRKVYKKVIQRLLKESKAMKTPTPTKRKIHRRRK